MKNKLQTMAATVGLSAKNRPSAAAAVLIALDRPGTLQVVVERVMKIMDVNKAAAEVNFHAGRNACREMGLVSGNPDDGIYSLTDVGVAYRERMLNIVDNVRTLYVTGYGLPKIAEKLDLTLDGVYAALSDQVNLESYKQPSSLHYEMLVETVRLMQAENLIGCVALQMRLEYFRVRNMFGQMVRWGWLERGKERGSYKITTLGKKELKKNEQTEKGA